MLSLGRVGLPSFPNKNWDFSQWMGREIWKKMDIFGSQLVVRRPTIFLTFQNFVDGFKINSKNVSEFNSIKRQSRPLWAECWASIPTEMELTARHHLTATAEHNRKLSFVVWVSELTADGWRSFQSRSVVTHLHFWGFKIKKTNGRSRESPLFHFTGPWLTRVMFFQGKISSSNQRAATFNVQRHSAHLINTCSSNKITFQVLLNDRNVLNNF